jgi:hypothetical protein
MSEDILKQIRTGLEGQIKQVIEDDNVPQLYVHEVTQSYLLLQILDKLTEIEENQGDIWRALDRLDTNG